MDAPLFLNGLLIDGGTQRRGLAGLVMPDGRPVSGRQGIRPGGLSVTLGAGGLITVHPGLAYVDPGIATTQSGYWCCVSADESPASVAAADATNPRKDIVIVELLDTDVDSSGSKLTRIRYIQGVAAASPTAPATPSSSLRLGVIDVPRAGNGNAAWTPDSRYTVASGGVLPVASQAERDALTPYPGETIWRLDRGWAETQTGTGWRVVGTPVCTSVADLAAITSPYAGQLATITGSVPMVVQYDGTTWRTVSCGGKPWSVSSTVDSAAVTDEAAVLTINGVTLAAGVAYRVEVGGSAWAAAATAGMALRLHIGSALIATPEYEWGRPIPGVTASATAVPLFLRGYVVSTAGKSNVAVMFTLTSTTGSGVRHGAAANRPRWLELRPVGLPADVPAAVVIP